MPHFSSSKNVIMFVDSHAHIDAEEFDVDRVEVLERARAAGVSRILTIGTGDPHGDALERAIKLADSCDDVLAAVGVHPHDARLYDDAAEAKLTRLLMESAHVVALGEIGLDYHYAHSPRASQRQVFVRQLWIARSQELPVIIHSREADEDTVTILKQEWGGAARPAIMHCFGGSQQMAEELLSEGCYISFAGNVTFKKADALRNAARMVPLDRLLVETDCPYLSPAPLRGRRNEPANVLHTAQFLADLKGVEIGALARATTDNFERIFGLESAGL